MDLSNEKANKLPGPGSYGDHVKWDKRTYNLKFLNVGQNSPQRMMNSPSVDMGPQSVSKISPMNMMNNNMIQSQHSTIDKQ